MNKFFKMIWSFCLCVLTLNALVRSFPQYRADQAEEVDNGYLGMAKKTIPKSVLSINLRLIKNLSKEKPGENILHSAAGAYSALMVLHLAAGNKTRKELDKVFKITDPEINHEKLHEAFSAVLKEVQHLSSGPDDQLPETFFTNGLFVQKGRPILGSFIESLNKYYAANATNVDFLEHASEATDLINAWISKGTNKRIQKFYTSPLPSTTVSILVNEVFFKGVWMDPFDKSQTKTEKFSTGTDEIEVPFMRNQKVVAYSRYDDLSAESIELPYNDGEYSMLVTMPCDDQTLKNFTEHIHKFNILECIRNTEMLAVDYKIPKLKISFEKSLVNALGLDQIFRYANLSRMSAKKVPVSDISQSIDLEMDEQGTTVSSDTLKSNTRLLSPPVTADKQFYVNRPYIMTVVHKPTLMILFEAFIYKPHY